jgi:hypothetical protein
MVILDFLNLLPIHEGWPFFDHQFSDLATVLAQRIDPADVDIFGNVQRSFKHFIESGQAWALGIGFVLGYMFRNFTAY